MAPYADLEKAANKDVIESKEGSGRADDEDLADD